MDVSQVTNILDGIFSQKLFEINQTPVTISSIIMFLIVLLLFVLFSHLLQKVLLNRILRRFQMDPGTRYNLARITHYVILIVGALVAFQFVGIDLSGLAVIFGLLSVGIGFGLQNVTSNFVAGLILLFERPIKIGDRITVGELQGDVIAINMRSTTIRSLDNITIIVPNSEFISSQVVNWSHGDPTVRLVVEVGVSYNSDLDKVINSLYTAAKENPDVLDNPEPKVFLSSFGDSSWNMKLLVWLADSKHYYRILSDINMEIVRQFRKNGVEIPFPQRDLHVRSSIPVPVEKSGNGQN